MRLKIFKKFFITVTVIALCSIMILMLFLSFFIRNYLEDEKKATLLENCSAISGYTEVVNTPEEFPIFTHAIMSITGKSSDAVYFIADREGNVISCGCNRWSQNTGCEHSAHKIEPHVMDEAMNGEFYRFGTLNGKNGSISYITAVPLRLGKGGAVFGMSPSYTMRQLMSNMYKVFAISVIIPVVLLFIALYVMTLKLTKPMRMMSRAAQSISRGDFSMRIPVYGDDEISELSASFNNMTDSLSRLESMRRSFIGNVSHELKTPMTTIGGFIDGILDGTIPKDQQERYLGIISDEVKRLTRVVQSMMSLAKLESGEMELNRKEFDIASVLFEVAISQEKRIGDGKIDILGLDEIDPVYIEADRDLIHQVIYNLVDNAIKFTPEKGYIRFELKAIQNKGCVVKIRNSGCGIDQSDLPYIFERFYKTDKSRSANKDSAGIGLYIVKTVVSIHGGSVSVDSVKDEYTEFEIILPGCGNSNHTTKSIGGNEDGKQ